MDCAEDNRECKVFPFQNIRVDDALYNGYEITIECNIRDIDKHRAILVSEHQVLIECVSVDSGWIGGLGIHQKACIAFGGFHQSTQDAQDVLRVQLTQDPNCIKKRLLLDFGDKISLSNDVFNDKNQSKDVIENKFYLTDEKVMLRGTKYGVTKITNSWKVTVQEDNTRRVNKKYDNGIDSKLAAGLAGTCF